MKRQTHCLPDNENRLLNKIDLTIYLVWSRLLKIESENYSIF
jgi:hypothetical protein